MTEKTMSSKRTNKFTSALLALCMLGAGVSVIMATSPASSSSGGMTTAGYDSVTAGCSCHSGGATPTLAINSLPDTFGCLAGTGYPCVSTSDTADLMWFTQTGAQAKTGGNVWASGGVLSGYTAGGTTVDTYATAGEVTHSGAIQANYFAFNWDPPSTAGWYTIQGWINSVNGTGDYTGDKSAKTALQYIAVCNDDDADGYIDQAGGGAWACPTGTDCNDNNAAINTSATEICDNVDNNCNGTIDEGCDNDGDDYCDSAMTKTAVVVSVCPNSGTGAGNDCNDNAIGVNPGATESCNNTNDDCDAFTDEGCDDDGDGYCDAAMAKAAVTVTACSNSGTAAAGNDCNDLNASIKPGVAEVCDNVDNNCTGAADEGCDDDGDDYCDSAMTKTAVTVTVCPNTGTAAAGNDCNDANAAIKPGVAEVCDNVDNNCSGAADEGCDDDNDDYCDSSLAKTAVTVTVCPNTGTAAAGNDCNDLNAAIKPGVAEICDNVDNNCSGAADEGCDDDGDDYCDTGLTYVGSTTCPNGSGDCNDAVITIKPGGVETCNNADDNCNASTDEGCDDDGDDYCDASMTYTSSTTCPNGGSDCNDGNAAIKPGIAEICNDLDDNCTGAADEGCDDDNDNYCDSGLVTTSATTCTSGGGDCNDTNSAIKPGVTEVCDNIDNNCAGSPAIDEGCDDDNDDYCDAAMTKVAGTVTTCVSTGTGTLGNDCNDASASIKPGATEICDNIDNNCSGAADEGCDDDNDDYCDSAMSKAAVTVTVCPNTGTAAAGNDCNDSSAISYPGATEVCDGLDNNCAGGIDDSIGPTTCGFGVCQVTQGSCVSGQTQNCTANAAAATTETCANQGVDNDCDGLVNEIQSGSPDIFSGDACSTGQNGQCSAGTYSCSGSTLVCVATLSPAVESCANQGVDNDCDGSTLELEDPTPGPNNGDEKISGAACVSGQAGICSAGTYVCSGGTAICQPTVTPGSVPESCSNTSVDNDCDGDATELTNGVHFGDACTSSGLGECQPGKYQCVANALSCVSNLGPSAEVCDNKDNNCNGSVDDGVPLSTCGVGECANTGSTCFAASCTPKPSSAEICDNKDNNCNGTIDEGCDDDNDDFCDAAMTFAGATTCPNGGGDCNDTSSAVKPTATESCNNVDDNCSSVTDEGCDDDGDDYCDASMAKSAVTVTVCPSSGTAAAGNDCDDTNNLVKPGVSEKCDNVDENCNGTLDEGCDDDNDDYCDSGITYSSSSVCPLGGGDCNDTAAVTHPNASEICDGNDNNCDGATDENIPILSCGIGECMDTATACIGGVGQACTPKAPSTEVCDGKDNDCDGINDNGIPKSTCGVGQCAKEGDTCNPQSCDPNTGSSAEVCDDVDNDCDGSVDDGVPLATCGQGICARTGTTCHPESCIPGEASLEICDGLDNDCNGTVDEGLPLAKCGVGACATVGTSCMPSSCVPLGTGSESCDNIDNDCDGDIDEGCDDDGDGYCDASLTFSVSFKCPNGGLDCDDDQADTHPAAPELCDNIDNDCNTAVDDNITEVLCGVGACKATGTACVAGVAQNCVPLEPEATDACDGVDNDCDGLIDSGTQGRGIPDQVCGQGACQAKVLGCLNGTVPECVEATGADESCDGIDNDCNGVVDDGNLCEGGYCTSGVCRYPNFSEGGASGVPTNGSGGAHRSITSTAGAASFDAIGGQGGASGGKDKNTKAPNGCGCEHAGQSGNPGAGVAILALFVALGLRRRSAA